MNTNRLTVLGLLLLGLNPFSIISNDLRLLAAIGLLVVFGKQITHFIATITRGWSMTISVRRFVMRYIQTIYVVFAILFVYSIMCAVVSIALLVDSGDGVLLELSGTAFRQTISLLFSFVEIAGGYYLGAYAGPKVVRKVIYGGFMFMSAICIYQFLSEPLHLPFVGNYVFDRFVGLRPSGFAVEPKFLSVYIVTLAFLLWDDRLNIRAGSAIRLCAIALCVFIFAKTSSANGVIGLLLMLIVRLTTFRAWKAIALVLTFVIGAYALFTNISLDDLGLRGSHADLLEHLDELDLLMFDDLIALPLLAWRDNTINLWLGFGPGMLHYFAKAYISNATWVTDDVYIKGNISAISFISHFGLIVFTSIFVFVAAKARRLMKTNMPVGDRAVDLFFVNSFVLGALISGNVSIPFYISIGWILFRAVSVTRQSRCGEEIESTKRLSRLSPSDPDSTIINTSSASSL